MAFELMTPNPTQGQRGDVAQLVERRTGLPLTQFPFPLVCKGFFSRSAFSADPLSCVRTPPCVIACINICAHVEDPVVLVRVRWITEGLKHPACTVGWGA